MITYQHLKKFLFRLDPERAHHIAGWGLKTIQRCPFIYDALKKKYFIDHEILHQKIFGHLFYNPVGLAAGFDKNGTYIQAMPALGFGFSEIGTVTPKPQEGNPKPRLFRLIEDEAIQNAMGFNNDGAEAMRQQLEKLNFFSYPIGINIGKNKTTSEEEALNDYEKLFKTFHHHGAYMVVNISSPNTPGLRNLQNETFIKAVFALAKRYSDKPVLLKLSPDMPESLALDLSQSAIDTGAAGIIATNTTVEYALCNDPHVQNFGGISGAALRKKSRRFTEVLGEAFYDKTLLISVGGIDSAHEAFLRIKAGASLVQLYTPLIYHGPSLIRKINLGLISLLKQEGFTHINDAIGSRWR